jgi:hypothetical protein
MNWVRCETEESLSPRRVIAAVKDIYGRRHSFLVDRGFLTVRDGVSYMPVGVVFRDKEKNVALIEFQEEAGSGCWRAWVSLDNLLEKGDVSAA